MILDLMMPREVSVVANTGAMACCWQLIAETPTSLRAMHASVPVRRGSGLLDYSFEDEQ